MQSSPRTINILLEGLPNIDDAYLNLELQAKKILPVDIEQIKNGSQFAYILEYDLDKLKSNIVNVVKIKSLAHQTVKLSYYINQNYVQYDKETKAYKIYQCSQCQGFGHHSSECKKSIKCGKCAKAHLGKDCTIKFITDSDRDKKLLCPNCFGKHAATSFACPVIRKQLLCANCDGNHTAFSNACPVLQDIHKNYKLYHGKDRPYGVVLFPTKKPAKTSQNSSGATVSSRSSSCSKDSY